MRRRVRLADVRPSGRLRLDAVARYLQDVAVDDVREAGVAGEVAWVVRRTEVAVVGWPRYEDVVDVATWCSGVGVAWAERRTTISRDRIPAVETVALWVSLDPVTMRPVPPTERFVAGYGPTGADRRVRTRLSIAPPGIGVGPGRPWPLRSTDLDVLGHVNNAVAWVAVEDELAQVPEDLAVIGAEVEYRTALEPDDEPVVSSSFGDGVLSVWLSTATGEEPAVSGRVRTAPPGSRRSWPPRA